MGRERDRRRKGRDLGVRSYDYSNLWDRNIFVWNIISARPSSVAQMTVLIMTSGLDLSSDCLEEEEDRRISKQLLLISFCTETCFAC